MAMVHERHTYVREHLQWAFKGAPSEASEYHLIDLNTGVSHGGFETLFGARQCAREKTLPAWDIFHGNLRVEYHDPSAGPSLAAHNPMVGQTNVR